MPPSSRASGCRRSSSRSAPWRCFGASPKGSPKARETFPGFRPSFLAIGQGYLRRRRAGAIADSGRWPRSRTRCCSIDPSIGRAWYAIGLGEAGARYAGLPVARRVALAYVLAGAAAGLAAIIYAAHLGQARSDAGTGYELAAITAVVLGGASVTGGRGTIGGTILGLAVVAVLTNGLQLAALPSELAGVLTGVVLVAAIALDPARAAEDGDVSATSRLLEGETLVRNSQVAILCAAILAGALLVAGTNVWMVRSIVSTAPRRHRAARRRRAGGRSSR